MCLEGAFALLSQAATVWASGERLGACWFAMASTVEPGGLASELTQALLQRSHVLWPADLLVRMGPMTRLKGCGPHHSSNSRLPMPIILVQVGWPIEDLHSWANSIAVKASELLTAAQHTPVAVETVIGVLLAATHGWPEWAHAEASPQPGRPPVQQLALVTALSHQLKFAAILQSNAVRYGSLHPLLSDHTVLRSLMYFVHPGSGWLKRSCAQHRHAAHMNRLCQTCNSWSGRPLSAS